MQTNATLIDDAWCDFFVEHDVRVSVSVDGPAALNGEPGQPGRLARVRPDRARHRDAAAARASRSPRCAWSSAPRPGLAGELYAYFLELGCDVLGINIEEQEGVNARRQRVRRRRGAALLGASSSTAWRRDPRIHLREIEWTLRYAGAVLDGTADEVLPRRLDPIPTIAARRLGGPALAGAGRLHRPAVRRLHRPATSSTTPLAAILARAATSAGWIAGVPARASRRAGPAARTSASAAARTRPTATSSMGRFDVTETNHCRNSKIRLLEGVLDHAGAR